MGRTASQTRPAVFILRHQGEHRLRLKTISPLAVLPGGDWWGPLPKDTRTDWRSELMKLTQVHTAGEFEAGIWIWGVTPEAELNLQCAVTTSVHLTNCHSFWIWGNWSISEVNSFLLSTYVYFAYSVPGSALSTGVMATNKTEVSEIIALRMDEKMSPLVHRVYLLAH